MEKKDSLDATDKKTKRGWEDIYTFSSCTNMDETL